MAQMESMIDKQSWTLIHSYYKQCFSLLLLYFTTANMTKMCYYKTFIIDLVVKGLGYIHILQLNE